MNPASYKFMKIKYVTTHSEATREKFLPENKQKKHAYANVRFLGPGQGCLFFVMPLAQTWFWMAAFNGFQSRSISALSQCAGYVAPGRAQNGWGEWSLENDVYEWSVWCQGLEGNKSFESDRGKTPVRGHNKKRTPLSRLIRTLPEFSLQALFCCTPVPPVRDVTMLKLGNIFHAVPFFPGKLFHPCHCFAIQFFMRFI